MDDTKQTIKDLFATLLEVAENNYPEVYLMPKSVYNEIVKKIQYLEDALKDIKQSRDNWKNKYKELKNGK